MRLLFIHKSKSRKVLRLLSNLIRLKINIVTLGCSKNNVDSEVLAARLQSKGHIVYHNSAKEHGIDAVVINTCAFIQDAKQQAIDEILLQAERKKQGHSVTRRICVPPSRKSTVSIPSSVSTS